MTFIQLGMVRKRNAKTSASGKASGKSFRSDVRHVQMLKQSAKEAVEDALRVSRALSIPITYLEGNDIVKEHPDGRKEIIGSLGKATVTDQLTLEKGDVIHVRRK